MIVSELMATGNSAQSAQAMAGNGSNVTALGNNQATAAQLPASQNFIASGAVGTGVKLPPCAVGNEVWVYNNSGQTIAIFPFETAGVSFNGGSPVSSILTAKAMLFKAFSSAVWVSVLTA
jgi:hypothetical protein